MNYENLNIPKVQQKRLKDFIEKEIPKVKFFKPDGKPNKEWKIFHGKTWDAARDAARDAAWDAARDAAWDAARGASWDAAWDAARDAAWGAAWDAARDAALDAARDASMDAVLKSDYIVVADLKFKDKKKHLAHVNARWEVWQKGYGLFCDVKGVLYVYVKD